MRLWCKDCHLHAGTHEKSFSRTLWIYDLVNLLIACTCFQSPRNLLIKENELRQITH